MKIQTTVILLLGQLGLSSSQYCSEPWVSFHLFYNVHATSQTHTLIQPFFRQALESASLSLTAIATMVTGYQATVLTMVTASDAVRIFPVPPMVYLVNARLPVRGEPRIRKSLLARSFCIIDADEDIGAIVLDRADLRAVSRIPTGNKCRVHISQTTFVSAERIWSRRYKAIIQI